MLLLLFQHLCLFLSCVFLLPVSCVHFLSRTQAPMAAVFAGSPQLLGTVKLCSGWTVTSLPLFSDIRSEEHTSELQSR